MLAFEGCKSAESVGRIWVKERIDIPFTKLKRLLLNCFSSVVEKYCLFLHFILLLLCEKKLLYFPRPNGKKEYYFQKFGHWHCSILYLLKYKRYQLFGSSRWFIFIWHLPDSSRKLWMLSQCESWNHPVPGSE